MYSTSYHPVHPFLPQAIVLCLGLWKYKNKLHKLPADKWFSLVLKIVINKGIQVWEMLIENSVGYSKDKKEKKNLGGGARAIFKKTFIEK